MSRAAIAIVSIWGGAIALFSLINHLAGAELSLCLFKNATQGVPCPTCGSTRLVLYTISGRFLSAMLQNPLVFALLACFAIWAVAAYGFRRRIEVTMSPALKRIALAVIAASVLLNWAYVIAIDGPFENRVMSSVEQIQSRERGLYRFFAQEAPGENP